MKNFRGPAHHTNTKKKKIKDNTEERSVVMLPQTLTGLIALFTALSTRESTFVY